MTKQRIEWVDTGKFICIMFVMLSHLESNTGVLSSFYWPFFLAGFFFLSGYVHRQPATFREHMAKKVRGLLVPWFLFSNFNILLSGIITLKGQRDPVSEMLWNAVQIRGLGDGLWFVAALFMAFIPFYFLIKWERPVWAILLTAALSVVSVLYDRNMPGELLPWGRAALPWHIEYMFQAAFWMVLGYYFRQYGEAVFDRWNTVWGGGLLWIAYLYVAYRPFGGNWAVPVSYLRSILGVLAVVCISKRLPSNWYIRFVGANTLTYFALHGKVYAVIEAVLGKLTVYEKILNHELYSSILAVMITIIMSFLLMIPSEIINRWFPWVLGRKKK